MTVHLTERDVRMLVKCALCRWLSTDQLRRMYFADTTLNAVQKRLRKLADAGFLRSHREHPTAESIHAVGPKGKPLVEEKGVDVAVGGDVPGQVDHLLGVNDLRLGVEQGPVALAYCFAYWQLADLGWRYPVIPDLVFAVRSPARRVFVAEYDRGTETLDKLIEKLQRYGAGLEGFPFEIVLVVTEETRRFDLLGRAMRRSELAMRVMVSTIGEVREAGVFGTPFVELPGGAKRMVLDAGEEEPGE
jgi:Replication-relaxation